MFALCNLSIAILNVLKIRYTVMERQIRLFLELKFILAFVMIDCDFLNIVKGLLRMEKRIVVPFAPTLVESTRSIGYTFEAAVADIIDNSISAEATDIRICFGSKHPQWLCIEDNGWGMNSQELENAMRYGSQNPQIARRENDLGRFGLGLKMASLSQCRKVTVMSKKDGEISAACWDLDYIISQKDWALKFYESQEIVLLQGYDFLVAQNSGTVVIWEQFDRLSQEAVQVSQAFDEKIEETRKHVALVFHRFLGSGNLKGRLKISFNGEPVTGLDPFLANHPGTQPLSEQKLKIGREIIRVKPYILPYISKMSRNDLEQVGGKEELRQQQGFYIYRNKRLIIWGTWFRLIKQNELGKLARVLVDIPNSLDAIWEIDIKKSRASLPHFVKKQLADIVRNAVGRSERVYKYRGRNVQTDDLIHVWNPVDDRGTLQYRINLEMPLVKMISEHLDEDGEALFNSFLRIVEDSFPFSDVYYRMAKSEANANESAMKAEEVFLIAEQMVQQVLDAKGDLSSFLKTMDKIDFFVKYPDVVRQIREVYGNE